MSDFEKEEIEQMVSALREQVTAISEAVTTLRESGLTDRGIIKLIQVSAPTLPYGKVLTVKQIHAVMDGMENIPGFLFGYADED